MSEELRWYKVKDKEPPEDANLVLYNNGYYCFATYLPPRRGSKLGEWSNDEDTFQVKPNDEWCEIDPLFTSDAIEGKTVFIASKIKP